MLQSSYSNFALNRYFYESKKRKIQGTLIRNTLNDRVVLILGMPGVGKSELAKLLVSSLEQAYLSEKPYSQWEFLGEETIELILVKSNEGMELVCRIDKSKSIGVFRYLNWRPTNTNRKVTTMIEAKDGVYNLNTILTLGHNNNNANEYFRKLEEEFEADFSSIVEVKTIIVKGRDTYNSWLVANEFDQLFSIDLRQSSLADIYRNNLLFDIAI